MTGQILQNRLNLNFHHFQESPDLISSLDGYTLTVLSISTVILFAIGLCWIYGYKSLIIDFIFWFDPIHPIVTKILVIVFASVVLPIGLLVSHFFTKNSFEKSLEFTIYEQQFIESRICFPFSQIMMILRFGDVPLTQNTNSNDMCCIGTVDNECDSLNNCPDSTWVYALGWALCLLGLLIFLIAAFEELLSQIDYGIWNVRFS